MRLTLLLLFTFCLLPVLPAQEIEVAEYLSAGRENRAKADKARASAQAIHYKLDAADDRVVLREVVALGYVLSTIERRVKASWDAWDVAVTGGQLPEAARLDCEIRDWQRMVIDTSARLRAAEARIFAARRVPADERRDLVAEEWRLRQQAAAYDKLAETAERLVELSRLNARRDELKWEASKEVKPETPPVAKPAGIGAVK